MAQDAPGVMLKVIVIIHFVFSTWGSMSTLMPASYTYVHIVALVCGLWAVAANESADAVLMFLVTLAFSIFQDVLLLGLYESRGHNLYEAPGVPQDQRNEYRFALGMSIVNLVLKPFTGFLLYRIYQSRNTNTAFTFPAADRFTGFAGSNAGNGGGYEDIDNRPPPGPYASAPAGSGQPIMDKE